MSNPLVRIGGQFGPGDDDGDSISVLVYGSAEELLALNGRLVELVLVPVKDRIAGCLCPWQEPEHHATNCRHDREGGEL